MLIKEVLLKAQKLLQKQGIASAKLDAELLLIATLKIDKLTLYNSYQKELSTTELNEFQQLLDKRRQYMPIAKILGKKEFYGLDFMVNQDVLDPRPDTEILLDRILKTYPKDAKLNILELGVGSGCIIITLLNLLKVSRGTAVDISKAALHIAEQNAEQHHVTERLDLIESDLFSEITAKYDLLISNPPYIAAAEIEALDADVRLYDPMQALVAGEDGLDFYRKIAEQAHNYLNSEARIILEIGHQQKAAITKLFQDQGYYLEAADKDYGGNDRVLVFSY